MITLLINLNLVTTYGLPAFISIACAEALENHYGVKDIAERYAARRTLMLEAVRGMARKRLPP